MAIIFSCSCGKTLKAKDELGGMRTKCPFCGKEVVIPKAAAGEKAAAPKDASPKSGPAATAATVTEAIPVDLGPEFDWNASLQDVGSPKPAAPEPARVEAPAAQAAAATPAISEPEPNTPAYDGPVKRYKIIMPKDLGYSVKFDAAKVEAGLNQYARQGWTLKCTFVVPIPGHGGVHDEVVYVLEQ